MHGAYGSLVAMMQALPIMQSNAAVYTENHLQAGITNGVVLWG